MTSLDPAAREIFDEINRWPIFDPHSHIDPLRPAARSFDEILGYHYYTELAHSAGMPARLVDPEIAPRERVRNLASYLDRLDNTVQYAWLIEIARDFHGFAEDRIRPENIDALFDAADRSRAGDDWDARVWERSNLEAVFLTNDFDDPLEGFDRTRFIPCLRVDDLVLRIQRPATIDRLKSLTNREIADLDDFRKALAQTVERFVAKGARACAVSLPPDFAPKRPDFKRASTPFRRAIHGLDLRPDEIEDVRKIVFWLVAEQCAEHRLAFDLMIGPIRDVYAAGVAGGRDLFDRRASLHDYQEAFNHFSSVTFPVSTLSPDASPELTAFAWIFPNVVPLGHWWYSNIPAFITADLAARLQALPKTKPVGYYSDAYKLEFILPKFTMYKRVLSEVLAADFRRGRGWSIDRALDTARRLLLENPRRLFAARDAKTRGE